MGRFGTLETPAIDEITQELAIRLPTCAALLGEDVTFGDFEPLALKPKKTYTAGTAIPVFVEGEKQGDMYAILFRPGDGTGDETRFKIGQLDIPLIYNFAKNPQRVFPRSKAATKERPATVIEAVFPLFSIADEEILPYDISLEELGVNNNRIQKLWQLGGTEYVHLSHGRNERSKSSEVPAAYLTVGTSEGTRFGDPHAIYANRFFVTMQVAGFLATYDTENPLTERISRVAIVPSRFRSKSTANSNS